MSTSYDILAAMLVRCQTIKTASSFNTDIGLNAQIAAPNLNHDEVTAKGALVIYDTSEAYEEDVTIDAADYLVRLEFSIECHMTVGDNNAVSLAHNMTDDIKTAVLLANSRTIGGLALNLYYAGRDTEYPDGAGNIVSVQVNFYALFTETYGDP